MTTSSSSPSPGASAAPAGPRFQRLQEHSLTLVFLALFTALSLSVDYFLSVPNMIGLALSVSQIGMVACAMTFCLASRDFDLSIGSTVALSGVLCAVVINSSNSIALGVVAALGAGALIGLVNGLLIAKLRINALIATLASMEIVRGLAFISSGGQAVGIVRDDFFALGSEFFLGVPLPVWIMGACVLVFGLLLNRTVYGRNTLAIGGNPEAARLAGIILASRITSGQPNAAQDFELNVISACVLGGVSLMGGRASIFGMLIGVLIMGTVQNAMNLLNIDAFYQYVVRGGILLIAVALDQLKQGRDAH